MTQEQKGRETMMNNEIMMLAPVGAAQMNSFIIRTEDEKTIVIDGGYRADAVKLLAKLREVTGSAKPHVDAWILSHAHDDHIEAFMEAMTHHADEFSLGRIYYHFPSLQFVEKHDPVNAFTIREFYELLPTFSDRLCFVSRGDEYRVGAAVFEILYTADPTFTEDAGNNATTVFRMTLGGKRVMFLGDAGVRAGEKLLAMHGSGLKSDFCQMAHHGQRGVERDVYAAISTTVCFWCTPLWLWNNDNGEGFDTHIWKTVTVRSWMEELGVREHYVIKDGDAHVIL